jgi:hypothetical protein
VNFSNLCKGFRTSTVGSQRHISLGRDPERRKGEAGDEGLNREMEGREPRISQIFENGVSVAVNPSVGVMAKDMINLPINIQNNSIVNACVELVINMELMCGPGGQWDISWAKVSKSEAGAQSKTQSLEATSACHTSRSRGPKSTCYPLRVMTHHTVGPP